ncbi:hypothetical protein [Leeia aquatica]|uniref:Lipoprotein n=1 Tax=Leeia aquatica TaxID=2725557 RepID=A0A847SFT8_9NEIS|nr:hypothetical protein [Leeia aquatica]NLR76109.1 hypothetical protein [Leeia aquatica]
MKAIFAGLLLTLGVMSAAQARQSAPVIDWIDIPVATASGKPVKAEQVREAIIAAGNGLTWEVHSNPNGKGLVATVLVRNKHTAVVNIPYDATKYSILYSSSINLNYEVSNLDVYRQMAPNDKSPDGIRVIHPNYNSWVNNLRMAIQRELNKL